MIAAGDRMQVAEIIESLIKTIEKTKKYKKSINSIDGGLLLDNIDINTSLVETESILELLLLTFCKAFHISPKMAAGLLTQKFKYLNQIMIKGLKGDYKPIYD